MRVVRGNDEAKRARRLRDRLLTIPVALALGAIVAVDCSSSGTIRGSSDTSTPRGMRALEAGAPLMQAGNLTPGDPGSPGAVAVPAPATGRKPNILFLTGEDVGWMQPSLSAETRKPLFVWYDPARMHVTTMVSPRDTEMESVLKKLEDAGTLDDTLIVFTTDHLELIEKTAKLGPHPGD